MHIVFVSPIRVVAGVAVVLPFSTRTAILIEHATFATRTFVQYAHNQPTIVTYGFIWLVNHNLINKIVEHGNFLAFLHEWLL